MKDLDPAARAALDRIAIARLCELLAERLRVTDGEIRIVVKESRYQRATALIPIGALPR